MKYLCVYAFICVCNIYQSRNQVYHLTGDAEVGWI